MHKKTAQKSTQTVRTYKRIGLPAAPPATPGPIGPPAITRRMLFCAG